MTTNRHWVLASNNGGKIAEFNRLLAPWGIEVSAQKDLGVTSPEETATTFVENALIKARHAARISGLPALADDSGLAVDALGGAPGVYSARYAGEPADDEANNRKLLEALTDTPDTERGACFHCVLVLMRSPEDPIPMICHGQWPGRIAQAPAGGGGFGYDPLFLVPEEGCTAAELPVERKAHLSHRGRAMAELRERLGDAVA
ncbi:RdgB/HAM1 family non-canonical purine NTP pyrophosphatase [Halomonadaceae bacterium KBTZ08]